MSPDDADRARARADLCRFLAACYYEPGPEFGEEKLFDSLRQAARAVDPELEGTAEKIGRAYAEAAPEDLLVDYTRLFLGPTGALARPYGSVWLGEGPALMQESTVAVARLYEASGFELSEGFRELPDHVAAELEFLYLLLHEEARSSASADAAAARVAADRRRQFLRDHLGAWIHPFAQAVVDGAQSDYFREIARLTERFVLREAAA